MKTFVIYKFTNKINNKIYIGKTQNLKKRISTHIRLSKNPKNRFHLAIKKYGINNFKVEVLKVCKNQIDLSEREQYYISYFKSIKKGYNLTEGGTGGDVFSFQSPERKQEILRKRSKSMLGKNKGKKCSEEQKIKISKTLTGSKDSLSTKIKKRKSALLKWKKIKENL